MTCVLVRPPDLWDAETIRPLYEVRECLQEAVSCEVLAVGDTPTFPASLPHRLHKGQRSAHLEDVNGSQSVAKDVIEVSEQNARVLLVENSETRRDVLAKDFSADWDVVA